MTAWSEVVTEARRRAGLSQRALARRAGVPASTVNRIELGRMSPTVEMLDRLLAAAGTETIVAVVPTIDDALAVGGLNESERRSLVLSVVVARFLLLDPVAGLALARRNLERMEAASDAGGQRYVDAWRQLLDGPTVDVVAVLTGLDEHSKALRQASPFAGLIPEADRRATLRRLRAA